MNASALILEGNDCPYAQSKDHYTNCVGLFVGAPVCCCVSARVFEFVKCTEAVETREILLIAAKMSADCFSTLQLQKSVNY